MPLPPSSALFTPSRLAAPAPRAPAAPPAAPVAAPLAARESADPEPIPPEEAAALLVGLPPAAEVKPLSAKQRERIDRLMAAVKAEVSSSLERRMFESSDSRDPA